MTTKTTIETLNFAVVYENGVPVRLINKCRGQAVYIREHEAEEFEQELESLNFTFPRALGLNLATLWRMYDLPAARV